MKPFLSYQEQLDRIIRRGMEVDDPDEALSRLRQISYYRLSGYWYPFRRLEADAEGRADDFYPGSRFSEVLALYDFDARLRAVAFSALSHVETAVRALLGHELGGVDPYAHLDPHKLGPAALVDGRYERWRKGYDREVKLSREDFVAHHRARYGGVLPVWVAVEILDWGSLSYLFGFSPRSVQDAVADVWGLRGPQLASWLKTLNITRNVCAHHGRLFNRVHALQPRLPALGRHPDLDAATDDWTRTFGQLALIQFLLRPLETGNLRLLPAVVRSFPQVRAVPLAHLGAPEGWEARSRLWEG